MGKPRPALAHLGIFVWDLGAMERFYAGVFGLVVTDRGVARAPYAAAIRQLLASESG